MLLNAKQTNKLASGKIIPELIKLGGEYKVRRRITFKIHILSS